MYAKARHVVTTLSVVAASIVAVHVPDQAGFADSPTGGRFVPIAPARSVDTRTGAGGLTRALAPTEIATFVLGGRSGVPASGVSAVAIDVTVAAPSATGYLRLWPADQPSPNASHVNFQASQPISNSAMIKLGAAGDISIYNGSSGTVHVVIDVNGYFTDSSDVGSGGRFTAVTPARLVDTRGVDPLSAGEVAGFQVTGLSGVPTTGVASVVVNVTTLQPTVSTLLTAWAEGQPRPAVPQIDAPAGQNLAALLTVPVSATGRIALHNAAGTTDVFVDVQGWFSSGPGTEGGRFTAVTPARLVDSRNSTGLPRTTPLAAGESASFTVAGVGGVPTSGVSAVALNVTAVAATSSTGYLTLWQAGTARPSVSHVHTSATTTRANLVIVRPSADGRISLYNFTGTTHVLVDVQGWFSGVTPSVPNLPTPSTGVTLDHIAPELAVLASDPEGDPLTVAFTVQRTDTNAVVVGGAPVDNVPSGERARFIVPLGALLNGVEYRWWTQACVGTACSAASSPATFRISGSNSIPAAPSTEPGCIDWEDADIPLDCGAPWDPYTAYMDAPTDGTTPGATLYGYVGPHYSDTVTNAVRVMTSTVDAASSGAWRASGLVRNELLQQVASGVAVEARLFDAADQLLAVATGSAENDRLRPGEPGAFTVASAVNAADVARVEYAASALSISPAVTWKLLGEVSWQAPYGERERLDGGTYTDPAVGPLPYVAMGTVVNEGETAANAIEIVGAWLDNDGKVRHVARTSLYGDDGQLATQLAPGDGAHFWFAVTDPVIAPALIDLNLVLWQVSQ